MEWNVAVALAFTVLGGCLSYLGFVRSKSKEDRDEGQQNGVVLTELGYIRSSIDNINAKLDRQDERYVEVIARLSAVEASAKQAHKRLDTIEGRTHP